MTLHRLQYTQTFPFHISLFLFSILNHLAALLRLAWLPTPLLGYKYVGSRNFKKIGEQFFKQLVEAGGLKPDDHVCEVGCGIGRIAYPLTRYLRPSSSYHGFDIVPHGIKWCQKIITPRFSHFHFRPIDIHNSSYNPQGTLRAETFRFPYQDNQFDFLFLASVFTHMLPQEMEHYMEEMARVLKPGGRCLASFFLINDESKELMQKEIHAQHFPVQHDAHTFLKMASRPCAAVAYEENFVRSLFHKHNLHVQNEAIYGRWCGRKAGDSGQDILVAIKK